MSACLLIALAFSADPTGSDLRAGFDANLASLLPLRVIVQTTTERTEEARANQQLLVEGLDRLSKQDTSLSSTEKQQLQKNAAIQRKQLETWSANRLRRMHVDLWRDSDNWQWRCPPLNVHGEKETKSPAFPDVLADAENLATLFKDLRVSAFGTATDRSLRVWQAEHSQTHHIGSVWIKSGAMSGTTERLPPLALPPAQLSSQRHWMDEFFQGADSEWQCLGHCQIGDHDCWLVEKRSTGMKSSPETIRAFLDPLCGCLPRRIEFFAGDLSAFRDRVEPATNESSPYFTSVCRNIELKKIDNESYYPVRGTREVHTPTTKNPDGSWKIIISEVSQWDASIVERRGNVTPDMFQLRFPPKTLYFDERDNSHHVADSAISGREARPEASEAGVVRLD